MIPTEEQAKALWDKYTVPEPKRRHMALVAKVAVFFAEKLNTKHHKLNISLVRAAALLHDIDKNASRLPGEKHPDTAVRILTEEGMPEVAVIVKAHSLHALLDPTIAPKTLEEKVVYLADKMVKYDIVGVDRRFALWRAEKLPLDAMRILDQTYPEVKRLEQEIFSLAGVTLEDVLKLV